MALEAATFISQFVATNPPGSDPRKQGDDHIRLLKSVLQATFPNADRAFRFPEFLSKSGNYTVLEADDAKTIYCDTSATFTLTLPTPSFDGWLVHVVKQTVDANPVYVAPPAGTINGVAKIRVNVPYVRHTFVWTGAAFLHVTPFGVRPGVVEDIHSSTIPVGYILCYGQTLSGSSADYPELSVALGGIVIPDYRGRVAAGRDDMGGAQAHILDGYTAINASLGEQLHTLSASEMPVHTHAPSVSDPGHAHTYSHQSSNLSGDSGSAILAASAATTPTATTTNTTGIGVTIGNAGGGTAHNNVQPTLTCNKILRLC